MDNCKSKCVSAGMTLEREHDSFKATHKSPIIFPENVRGLVYGDDLKVPHSELATHVGAAGKDILAFFITSRGAYIAFDQGEGCCGFTSGLDSELLSQPLINKVRDMWGPTE